MYRGQEYTVDFVPKVKVEVVVPNEGARRAIDTIMRAAQTGQIGDGKIFVVSLDETVHIRTGERAKRPCRQLLTSVTKLRPNILACKQRLADGREKLRQRHAHGAFGAESAPP